MNDPYFFMINEDDGWPAAIAHRFILLLWQAKVPFEVTALPDGRRRIDCPMEYGKAASVLWNAAQINLEDNLTQAQAWIREALELRP